MDDEILLRRGFAIDGCRRRRVGSFQNVVNVLTTLDVARVGSRFHKSSVDNLDFYESGVRLSLATPRLVTPTIQDMPGAMQRSTNPYLTEFEQRHFAHMILWCLNGIMAHGCSEASGVFQICPPPPELSHLSFPMGYKRGPLGPETNSDSL